MRWLSKISEPWQLRLFNQPSAPDSLATTTASRHPLQDACQLQANVHQRPELAPGPQGLPGLHLRDPDLVRERLGRPEHRHLWGEQQWPAAGPRAYSRGPCGAL